MNSVYTLGLMFVIFCWALKVSNNYKILKSKDKINFSHIIWFLLQLIVFGMLIVCAGFYMWEIK